MEEREEYYKAMRDALVVIDSEEGDPNAKYKFIKHICGALIDDSETLFLRHSLLKEHVDELQEIVSILAINNNK
ncbi:MAG: hypothetical protein PSN34_05300 [Urechidicola sp.]|nr:hypothetical protein [Urechidicola sp.]